MKPRRQTKTWVQAATNIVRHKGGTYYLSATVGGKKHRVSLQTKNLAAAREKRDQALARLRFATGTLALGTVGDAVESVMAARKGKPGLKPRTIEYYERLRSVLRNQLPVDLDAALLDSHALADVWRRIVDKHSPSEANNLLSCLQGIGALLVERAVRADDPSKGLQRVRIPQSAVHLLPSRDELAAVVASVRAQRKASSEESANFIEFLAWSGLRIGEAQALKWQDIGPDWLTVTGGEEGTKSGLVRRVPLNAPLRAVIARMSYPDPSGRVFSLKSPRDALRAACARLGIKHLRIHDLRHLAATAYIEAGVDVPTVSRWLGHQDGGVLLLKTYGHLRDQHSLEQAKRIR